MDGLEKKKEKKKNGLFVGLYFSFFSNWRGSSKEGNYPIQHFVTLPNRPKKSPPDLRFKISVPDFCT